MERKWGCGLTKIADGEHFAAGLGFPVSRAIEPAKSRVLKRWHSTNKFSINQYPLENAIGRLRNSISSMIIAWLWVLEG